MPETAPQEADILNRINTFASQQIFPDRESLISSKELPREIWKVFANCGLAGLTIPSDRGGLGADYSLLSEAIYRLNRQGGVPGLTMVFSSHWLITKLHILRRENVTKLLKQKRPGISRASLNVFKIS